MIYLNAAGTSWPKPKEVADAMVRFNSSSPDQWLTTFEEGQRTVLSFFDIPYSDRFLFTQSCTQALSIAFSDFPWEQGDRLIISSMEHHALSRWYYKVQAERGVEGVMIPRTDSSPLDLDLLEKELQKGVKMVAITMASNVTGEILPYEEVLILSRKYGAMCLLDGAQTAGVIPISIKDLDPDFFVFAGHKGPLGPQGIGGLYISERVSMICPSAACEVVPGEKKANTFPSYCDVGSAPMITIAGLSAGIKWLQHQDFQTISTKAIRLAKTLREELLTVPKLSVVGAASCAHHTGAVSISSNEISLLHLNSLLWTEHKIKGSMGFQCAPLAHEVLGTSENGTLRFSLGPMSTEEEIEILIESLKKVVTGST